MHRKKNDLFYEDATCLCHSLVLWLSRLCDSALVCLAPWIFSERISVCLGLRPSNCSSVWFYSSFWFCSVLALRRAAFRFGAFCKALSQPLFLVVLLLQAHRRVPFAWIVSFLGFFDVLFLPRSFSSQRYCSFLVLCMASSSVLSVSSSVFLYAFFDKALLLSGFVLFSIPYVSYLLTLISRRGRHVSQPVAGWFHS